MEERQALLSFAALSQETRLGIVRPLVVAGPDGMASGSIVERLGVTPSNVSFHLRETGTGRVGGAAPPIELGRLQRQLPPAGRPR